MSTRVRELSETRRCRSFANIREVLSLTDAEPLRLRVLTVAELLRSLPPDSTRPLLSLPAELANPPPARPPGAAFEPPPPAPGEELIAPSPPPRWSCAVTAVTGRALAFGQPLLIRRVSFGLRPTRN